MIVMCYDNNDWLPWLFKTELIPNDFNTELDLPEPVSLTSVRGLT